MDFIFATSFVCFAVHVLFNFDQMPLKRAGDFLFDKLPIWISKPLFACLPCMASFYTLIMFVCASIDPTDPATVFLIYMVRPEFGFVISVLCVAAVNTIFALIIRLIEAIEAITDKNEFDDIS